MLARYSPLFAGDDTLRALFGLGDLWGWLTPAAAATAPRMDIVEKEQALEFVCDLPGAKPEDVHVTFENGVLTIHATRKNDYSDAKVHRMERYSGTITQSYRLGDGYDADGIAASLRDGILAVSVPKLPSAMPRKIPVLLESGHAVKQLEAGQEAKTN
jgi:HSP20 family protein